MMQRLAFILALVLCAWTTAPAFAADGHGGAEMEAMDWPFYGLTGTFDRASLQRGFQVYREVCASCHSLNLVAYRNLADLGYSEEQIKTIAAEATVTDGPNDEGEMYERPGRASDPFAAPYANDQAARVANGGALPPDLSLITKARVSGPDYIYHLLQGYEEAPHDMTMNAGMNYNKYFPGHQIAMPVPLFADQVSYADGTDATVAQMAWDVTQFLHWAAEPNLEARHQLGLSVLIFLSVFTALIYMLNKKIWAPVKKGKK